MGQRFESRLLLSTCLSVLGQQDTEPHIAPGVLVDTLHGYLQACSTPPNDAMSLNRENVPQNLEYHIVTE